ncbi:MAG: hypothetical protein WC406_04985, partial [Methanoregula sp.]
MTKCVQIRAANFSKRLKVKIFVNKVGTKLVIKGINAGTVTNSIPLSLRAIDPNPTPPNPNFCESVTIVEMLKCFKNRIKSLVFL